jgi:hypothetical protein
VGSPRPAPAGHWPGQFPAVGDGERGGGQAGCDCGCCRGQQSVLGAEPCGERPTERGAERGREHGQRAASGQDLGEPFRGDGAQRKALACAAGQRRRLEQLNVVASSRLVPHQFGKVTVIVPAGLCWQWRSQLSAVSFQSEAGPAKWRTG